MAITQMDKIAVHQAEKQMPTATVLREAAYALSSLYLLTADEAHALLPELDDLANKALTRQKNLPITFCCSLRDLCRKMVKEIDAATELAEAPVDGQDPGDETAA